MYLYVIFHNVNTCRKYLIIPQSLVLHEILYYNNANDIRKQINGSPRVTIQKALSNPYHYLQVSTYTIVIIFCILYFFIIIFPCINEITFISCHTHVFYPQPNERGVILKISGKPIEGFFHITYTHQLGGVGVLFRVMIFVLHL